MISRFDHERHICRPNPVECKLCHGDGTGTNDEAEFEQWYGAEMVDTLHRWGIDFPVLQEAIRLAAKAAFFQGLAVGREGRA